MTLVMATNLYNNTLNPTHGCGPSPIRYVPGYVYTLWIYIRPQQKTVKNLVIKFKKNTHTHMHTYTYKHTHTHTHTHKAFTMFYKAIVQTVLLFGSETWVVTNQMIQNSGVFITE